ncbi:hypothetical protein BY457_1276 [Marinilabilia salmonicolor]|jgi:hypothetical protein|uniref:carboxypeptidase-like regulatory domain-containing protein n=1 Tax=Marinilabilia salmonicolor TaxID=989 RepID=UPI000D4892ED|nr:carboxypeptidase-like regulatory domain-containing protein [Marinilabilia salmonicolor]PRY90323.1 hypothetical protein BY457_1276 [Marinilabilia salmonicolor]
MVSAQKTTGIISEATGSPLPKAHVLEKESMRSTLSDYSGRFSISINEDSFWSLTFIIDKRSLKSSVKSAKDIKIEWLNEKPNCFKQLYIEEENSFIIIIIPEKKVKKAKKPTTKSRFKKGSFFIGNPAKNKI